MAKLNEGDVIEGIFGLALAEIFAYGDIDKNRLNKERVKIEPEMFRDGRYEVVIRDTLGGGRGFMTESFPPDIFTVKLILRLKPASVEGAIHTKLHEYSTTILDTKLNVQCKEVLTCSLDIIKEAFDTSSK